MEKIPIDPLIKKQYDEQLAKDATDKAKALMELPEHQLMEQPENDLERYHQPDRIAENKTRHIIEDYKFMKYFYDDDISAMKAVKKSREKSRYAESIGENPDTFIGNIRPGKINKFVGDGEGALFSNSEIDEIVNLEENALKEVDNNDYKFINNIPEGRPAEPLDIGKFKNDLYGAKSSGEPYDQDKDDSRVA